MSKKQGFGFWNKKEKEPIEEILEDSEDTIEESINETDDADAINMVHEDMVHKDMVHEDMMQGVEGEEPLADDNQYYQQEVDDYYVDEQYEDPGYEDSGYEEPVYETPINNMHQENMGYYNQQYDAQYNQQYTNSAYVDPRFMNPRYSDPGYDDPNFGKTNYLPQINLDEQIEYQGDGQGFDGYDGRYGEYDEYGISDYMDDGFDEYDEYDEGYEQYEDGYDGYDDKPEDKSDSKDVLSLINEWIVANKMICYTVLGAILVLAVVLFVVAMVRKNSAASVSSNSSNTTELAGISGNVIPTDPLLINAYPEVNDIVNQYFTARQSYDMETIARLRNYEDPVEAVKLEAMSYYVQSYNDITCYTKPGPFEGSYLTYVTYNVKLFAWDQLAPSLLTMLICTQEDGSLYIYSGDFDKNVETYIAAVSSQEDVVDLMTRIDAEYKEVLDSNVEFNDYMAEFNTQIRDKVKEKLAAIKMEEEAANPSSSASENAAKEIVTFEVKATDTVNVRASDSEDADRVGRVDAGTVLTCYEQRTNGWSQVVYEGEIAYIKSDYLVNLSTKRTSTDADVIGTVKAKETVNIRDKDSTDGRQLGVAYMGDSFPLIEKQSNGWSKIVYNDMDAYIKTEYLE